MGLQLLPQLGGVWRPCPVSAFGDNQHRLRVGICHDAVAYRSQLRGNYTPERIWFDNEVYMMIRGLPSLLVVVWRMLTYSDCEHKPCKDSGHPLARSLSKPDGQRAESTTLLSGSVAI